MPGPFDNYLARQMGPPLLGYDPALLGDDDLGAFKMFRRRGGGRGGRGGRGGGSLANIRQALVNEWRQRGLVQGDEDLEGDDDLGDALGALFGDEDLEGDEDLGADDDEIGELEGEDDEVHGSDGQEQVGATVTVISNKIARIKRKIEVLQARYDNTPPTRFRRRRSLLKRIKRLRGVLAKKEAKKNRKLAVLAAKMGVPVAALAAGAAAGVAGSSLREENRLLGSAQAAQAFNMNGLMDRTPPAGIEQRVSMQDTTTGSQVVVISVAAGAGLRTAAIQMITPVISFAKFRVRGLDVKMQAIQGQAAANTALASEMLINCLLTNLTVNGDINLLYTTLDVCFGAQTVGNQMSARRTIPSLRATPILDKNNTASLTATFRQELTTTVAITATFEAALVCEVLEDSAAMRSQAA